MKQAASDPAGPLYLVTEGRVRRCHQMPCSLLDGLGEVFSLIDTVLVKTLPVNDPQRLFFVEKSGGSSGPPYPCFERLRVHNRFQSGIAAFDERLFEVSIEGRPERLEVEFLPGCLRLRNGKRPHCPFSVAGLDAMTATRAGSTES